MSSEGPYTIVLDDDPMIPSLISKTTGLPCRGFNSVEALMEGAKNLTPVCAFIDVNLGGNESGIDILPRLKQVWSSTPLIVITSDHEEGFIGQALAAGASDFIEKPLKHTEVVARMQARISEVKQRAEAEVVHLDEQTILHYRHRYLERGERRTYISPVETALLRSLADFEETLVSKKDLKRRIWGDVKVTDNALDRRLSSLRKALGEVEAGVKIESVYGSGVRLRKAS